MQKKKRFISKIFSRFNYFLIRKLENSLHFAIPFGFICTLVFSIFYILFFEQEIWWLDLSGTVLGILVLASAYNFVLSKKYLPIFWVSLLLFMAFNGTYLVFDNPSSIGNALGQMIVLMALTIIISDIPFLLLLLIAGISLAYLAHDMSHMDPSLIKHLTETGAMYLSGFLVGIALSRKRFVMERKREGMETLSHRLRHELNTPLMSIQGNCTILQQYLPQLISQYQESKASKKNKSFIPPTAIKQLANAAQQACNECTAAGSIMDIMTMNAKEPEQYQKHHKPLSIYYCIEKALQRYPFPTGFNVTSQVNWNKESDFLFDGVEILMIHVFMNLFKNAVHSILETGKAGKIDIYNKSDKNSNYVYVSDSGLGVKKKDMRYLFDSFYTTNREGTGLGLSFCKHALESFSGKIQCKSVYKKGATFILILPKLPKDKPKRGLLFFKSRFIHS